MISRWIHSTYFSESCRNFRQLVVVICFNIHSLHSSVVNRVVRSIITVLWYALINIGKKKKRKRKKIRHLGLTSYLAKKDQLLILNVLENLTLTIQLYTDSSDSIYIVADNNATVVSHHCRGSNGQINVILLRQGGSGTPQYIVVRQGGRVSSKTCRRCADKIRSLKPFGKVDYELIA